MNKKVSIRKNDQVLVISGDDKGKKGKVITVIPSDQKLIIEGINMVTKHKKPRKQGDIGGIIRQEAPVAVSKVMHICNKCNRPTRIGFDILGDGSKVRVCKKCGEDLGD